MLENVNFGLVIMRPTGVDSAFKSEKYIALKATANFAGLVGIDQFELSAAGITVEYNGVKNSSSGKVVDFSKMADGFYKLDTGSGELDLNYDSKRLLVSIAEANLRIADYVFVHGALAFQKVEDLVVTPVGAVSPKTVSAVNVGGEGLTMFFGVDGPYWTDLDGDNDITWALNTGNGNVVSRTISTARSRSIRWCSTSTPRFCHQPGHYADGG